MKVQSPHIKSVAPVRFKLTKFSQWITNKIEWCSVPFFAFKGGYQMYLKAYAAGYGISYDAGYLYGKCDESTRVSVSLFLTKGPYDDELEQSGHWPLRGIFTIELLNQLNDSDHYRYTSKLWCL